MPASKNETTLTFKGDEDALLKAFDNVEVAADSMGKKVKAAGDSVDNTGNSIGAMGEKADGAETSLIGVHDIIDGTATIMSGPGEAGLVGYIQGWADLAGGIAPIFSQLSNLSLAMVKNAATSVASGARVVASWVAQRVAAVASAIQIAAAWLISLGPVVLVIAGVAAVVAAFVILWKKSEAFRDFWKGVWNVIKDAAGTATSFVTRTFDKVVDFVTGLPGRIGRAASGMWDGIKDAFRAALNWIIDKWNGLEFSLPSFDTHIPGVGKIGGFTIGVPDIPRFHSGTISVPGGPGQEMLAILNAGERVSSGGDEPVRVVIDIRGGEDELKKLIRKWVRIDGGGSTQEAFG